MPNNHFTCPICFTYIPSSNEKTTLPCSCSACTDCLSEWLILKITENQSSIEDKVPCIMARCKKTYSLKLIYSRMPPLYQQKLNQTLFQVYLTKEQDIRKCPNSTCKYAGIINTESSCKAPLQCDLCGTQWRDPQHFTKSEKFLAWWKNGPTATAEERSQQWIKSKSKKCPSCKVNIEKNGGCNNMTCTKCKYEFCWLCYRTFPDHNHMMHFNPREFLPLFWIVSVIVLVTYFGFKFIVSPMFGYIFKTLIEILWAFLPKIFPALAANGFTALLIGAFSTFNINMEARIYSFGALSIAFVASLYFDYFRTMVDIMKVELVILPTAMAAFILIRGCLTRFSRDVNRAPIQQVQQVPIVRLRNYERRPKNSQKQSYASKSFVKNVKPAVSRGKSSYRSG